MKRAGKSLDVKTLDAMKPRAAPFRVSDGNGLLLEVRPSGAKVWLCRLTVDGKRRDMGLGGYPVVTLAAARAAALAARRQAREGVDPIAQREADAARRKAEKSALAEAEARTFKAVAEACITALAPGWKNGRTGQSWRSSLAGHVYPVIGSTPVAAVDRDAVLRAVMDVWQSRPEIGRKLLVRIGMVLRYAAAHGWRANDNPADARMLRHAGLPALAGSRKQPSLPWSKAPAFMAALDGMGGLAPLALRFCILTTVRSGEARGARWSEVSFEGSAAWTIPGERMKARKSADVQPHRVPLSPAAVAVLLRAYAMETGQYATLDNLPKLAALRGNALIFPSSKPDTVLSDMALSAVMRRMNADRPEGMPAPWRDGDGREAVPHGWRASFRTWVDDTRPEDAEAAEKALAHQEPSRVAGAYRRSDLIDRRRPLMDAWGEHCSGQAAGGAGRRVLAAGGG